MEGRMQQEKAASPWERFRHANTMDLLAVTPSADTSPRMAAGIKQAYRLVSSSLAMEEKHRARLKNSRDHLTKWHSASPSCLTCAL